MSTQQAMRERGRRDRLTDLAALEAALLPQEWRRPPASQPLRRIEFTAETPPRRAEAVTSARQRAVLAIALLLAAGAAAVAGLALLVNRPPAPAPLRAELSARVASLRAHLDGEIGALQIRVAHLQGQLAVVHTRLHGVEASIPQRAVDILGNQLRGIDACLPELQQELSGLAFTTRPDRKTGDLAAATLSDRSALSADCGQLLGISSP